MISRGARRRDSASILVTKKSPKLVIPPGAICYTDGCIEWNGGDVTRWGVDVGEGVALGSLLVVGCMTKYASTLGMVGSGGFVWWIFLRLRGRALQGDIGTRW